jgi:hypothetical protein
VVCIGEAFAGAETVSLALDEVGTHLASAR